MRTVAALTGSKYLPSSRYRVRQYIDTLATLGISVQDYGQPLGAEILLSELKKNRRLRNTPELWSRAALLEINRYYAILKNVNSARKHDITWLSRELSAGRQTFENFLKGPLVFDVDDAIWLNQPNGRSAAISAASRSEVVFAGNEFIAEWFSAKSPRVEIIPTAVDTDLYAGVERSEDEYNIGWIGTSSNFYNFDLINDALEMYFAIYPSDKFLIVSDRRPAQIQLSEKNCTYIPWSPDSEARVIGSFNVGLMPLHDTEWSRGKCSFKMLQYMSCEVPVVVSPVGMNSELLVKHKCGIDATNTNQWLDALVNLRRDIGLRSRLAQIGRKTVLDLYSVRVISQRIANIMGGI